MTNLDPAVEAAARQLRGWLTFSEFSTEDTKWEAEVDCATELLAVAAPLIRDDERAKVRAELLAIALANHDWLDSNWLDPSVVRAVADRIAPEAPKEQP